MHLVFRFLLLLIFLGVRCSLVGHSWSPVFLSFYVTSMCMSTATLESTVREGFGASVSHHMFGCTIVSCTTHLGWGDRLSTPQVQRLLLLLVRWLHRRKRDCTPALFLTSSVCTSSLSPCSEEEGLAPLPSGGGGIGPSPRTAGLYLGGRRTGLLPHNDGDYFGGGTGPPPHNVGKFL